MKRSLVAMVTTIAVFAGPVYAQLNPNRVAILRWYAANQTATFDAPAGPTGVAFDGANIWMTGNFIAGSVTKVRASDGTNLGNFPVGTFPQGVAFDGANVWVTGNGMAGTVTKLRASDGTTLGSASGRIPGASPSTARTSGS
jgi:hypothetical protein